MCENKNCDQGCDHFDGKILFFLKMSVNWLSQTATEMNTNLNQDDLNSVPPFASRL